MRGEGKIKLSAKYDAEFNGGQKGRWEKEPKGNSILGGGGERNGQRYGGRQREDGKGCRIGGDE